MDSLYKTPMGELTKAQIYDSFEQKIAESAIRKIDDEWQIVGKYCRVTWDGNGIWDIWVCNPNDMRAGLSQRRFKNIAATLKKCPVEGGFIELTGEGYTKVSGPEIILRNLDLLGIRRKRCISAEQRQKIIQRLGGYDEPN